jgi:hypothetical protein
MVTEGPPPKFNGTRDILVAHRVPATTAERLWHYQVLLLTGLTPNGALREACSQAAGTLPALMPHGSAVTAPSALGFPGHLFHDPFHVTLGA